MGAVSDEHGERFHQDIKSIEERYDGKSRIKMMADYCWFLKEETDPQNYARKAKRSKNTWTDKFSLSTLIAVFSMFEQWNIVDKKVWKWFHES